VDVPGIVVVVGKVEVVVVVENVVDVAGTVVVVASAEVVDSRGALVEVVASSDGLQAARNTSATRHAAALRIP
jgi:hypothetical protein